MFTLPGQLEPYLNSIQDVSKSINYPNGFDHCLSLGDLDYEHLNEKLLQRSDSNSSSIRPIVALGWLELMISNQASELLIQSVIKMGQDWSDQNKHQTSMKIDDNDDCGGDEEELGEDQALITLHGFKQLNVDLGNKVVCFGFQMCDVSFYF